MWQYSAISKKINLWILSLNRFYNTSESDVMITRQELSAQHATILGFYDCSNMSSRIFFLYKNMLKQNKEPKERGFGKSTQVTKCNIHKYRFESFRNYFDLVKLISF